MGAVSELAPTTPAMFACGDKVRIVTAPGLFGKVVELRGPLGPNHGQVYRVRVSSSKAKPVFVEVREDQLEIVQKK